MSRCKRLENATHAMSETTCGAVFFCRVLLPDVLEADPIPAAFVMPEMPTICGAA
jgi:hypothetical protein